MIYIHRSNTTIRRYSANDPYYIDIITAFPRSFQSVFGQRYDFADVVVRVTLPPTSQLDLGAVEEGIADCNTICSTPEEGSRIEKSLPMRSSSSVSVMALMGRPVLESRNTPVWSTNGAGRSFASR